VTAFAILSGQRHAGRAPRRLYVVEIHEWVGPSVELFTSKRAAVARARQIVARFRAGDTECRLLLLRFVGVWSYGQGPTVASWHWDAAKKTFVRGGR